MTAPASFLNALVGAALAPAIPEVAATDAREMAAQQAPPQSDRDAGDAVAFHPMRLAIQTASKA